MDGWSVLVKCAVGVAGVLMFLKFVATSLEVLSYDLEVFTRREQGAALRRAELAAEERAATESAEILTATAA